MYRRIRLKFYRLHCQFISGNDRRAPYDYFMLVCGPVSAKSQTLGCRRRSFDGWGGWSAYQGAAFPERAASQAGAATWSKMTPAFSKFVFVMLAIGWYLIRYEYARRSRREKVLRSDRGPRETALLLISLTGLGIVPFIYVATAIPHFAAYTFHPVAGLAGAFRCDCGIGHVSVDASSARPELVHQSRRAGGTPARHGRHLPESPAPNVFSILALGCRSGITAAELGCRLFRPGRLWDFVLWPRRQGRANDVGNLRRQLSRVYGADRPYFPLNLLKRACCDNSLKNASSKRPSFVPFLQHSVEKSSC